MYIQMYIHVYTMYAWYMYKLLYVHHVVVDSTGVYIYYI